MNRKNDPTGMLLSRIEQETLPSQSEAITAEEPLVVVSAGAGTGKTWTLAWRFVWAFLSGRADIRQILTLTFTEKAAQEMKDRIEMLLGRIMKELPCLGERASYGLEHLEEAYISTIHAFSMRTIKERGINLELDPQARVLSVPEERSFWRELEKRLDRMDLEWLRINAPGTWSTGQEIPDQATMRDLVNSYGAHGITSLASEMISLFSSLGRKPCHLRDWAENMEDRDRELAEELLHMHAPQWAEIWNSWLGPEGMIQSLGEELGGKTSLAAALSEISRQWRGDTPCERDLPRFLGELSSCLKGARGKLAERLSLMLGRKVSEYRQDLVKQEPLLEFLDPGLHEEERAIRKGLLNITSLVWAIWDRVKLNSALISFDDMIRYSIHVMERDRSYFSNFREILMDEFQDTNELQDLLLGKIWREPGEQRLFLVGDMKQSIYRFRHAEPSLFLRYIRSAGNRGGKYIPLDVSFRTRDVLIGEINSLFSSLWKKGIGQELDHPYEELRPPLELEWHERRQETSIPAFRSFLESRKPEGEQVEGARLRLARRLGTELQDMVGSGQMIWDKGLLEFRPARWSDIAILVPTRTYYEPLEKIFLDELFIPCLFESSLGYYSRSEIQDVAALVKALSDPEDEISLGHFISSPFSGIPLAQGDRLLQEYSGKDLWEGLASLFPEVHQKMEKWRKQAFLEGVSAILGNIIREPGIFLRFPTWKRNRAAANIRKAIDITREYEMYMGHDLQGCAGYIEDAVGRGVRMEDALLPGEDDHVRILTVHASKGLEFPVVAIFGCEHTPRVRAMGTSLGASKRLGPVTSRFTPYGDSNAGSVPLTSRLHDILEKREHHEEWERLFYVACTRARDSLILCGIDPKDEGIPPQGSWLSMVAENLQHYPGQADMKKADQTGYSRKAGMEKPSEPITLTDLKPGALKKIGASAFALFRFCPHAYRMKYRQGRDLKWELPSEEERGGPQMGSLMHWILERWDFRAGSIERLIPRNTHEASERALSLPPALKPVWNDQEVRIILRSWLEGMSRNPFCQELAKLDEKGLLQREFPFCLPIGEDIHLVGVMDLFWKDSSGIHILDHKITPYESSGPAREILYREQLSFYSLAMKKIYPREKIWGGIFYIRENLWHPLHDFPEWSLMERTVASTAARAAGEDLPPMTENCHGCPFYRLCDHPRKGRQ